MACHFLQYSSVVVHQFCTGFYQLNGRHGCITVTANVDMLDIACPLCDKFRAVNNCMYFRLTDGQGPELRIPPCLVSCLKLQHPLLLCFSIYLQPKLGSGGSVVSFLPSPSPFCLGMDFEPKREFHFLGSSVNPSTIMAALLAAAPR